MTRRYADGRMGGPPTVAPRTLENARSATGPATAKESLVTPEFNASERLHPNERLDRLCADVGDARPAPRTVIVVAHPDDEIIGAGARLPRLRDATILHVTDGSPTDLADTLRAGCAARSDYAALRRRELESVLAVVGMKPYRAHCLDVPDLQASLRLVEISRRLADIFAELQCEVALTHPYEGGHPDHDATAFCVHTACRILERSRVRPPLIVEMASCFVENGRRVTGSFLSQDDEATIVRELHPTEQALKRHLLNTSSSQWQALRDFRVDREVFRVAPDYDFVRPPHPGRLYYELSRWGMTGVQWRSLAVDALRELHFLPVQPPAYVDEEAVLEAGERACA